MASSSEACVFGGVRLISSASSRFVKTGPRRKENSALRASYTERAGDVARHQVGRELHPLGVQRERRREAPDEQRLGHPGHALEQHVARGTAAR